MHRDWNNSMTFTKVDNPAWRKMGAVVCLVAFLGTGLGHVAHRVDCGLLNTGTAAAICSASASVCPACTALHTSFAEAPFQNLGDHRPVRFDPHGQYRSPSLSGEFLIFFVRPPPALEAD